MKAQSQIIQFVLFFMIGLALFILLSNFYKSHADSLKERLAEKFRSFFTTYFSSYSIMLVDSCKYCEEINLTFKIANTTAGYYYEFYLANDGLTVKTQPYGKQLVSSLHNLNSSLTLSGFSYSAKPLSLFFIRSQNKLLVS